MNYIKKLLPWRILIYKSNSGDTSHLFIKTCGKVRYMRVYQECYTREKNND